MCVLAPSLIKARMNETNNYQYLMSFKGYNNKIIIQTNRNTPHFVYVPSMFGPLVKQKSHGDKFQHRKIKVRSINAVMVQKPIASAPSVLMFLPYYRFYHH